MFRKYMKITLIVDGVALIGGLITGLIFLIIAAVGLFKAQQGLLGVLVLLAVPIAAFLGIFICSVPFVLVDYLDDVDDHNYQIRLIKKRLESHGVSGASKGVNHGSKTHPSAKDAVPAERSLKGKAIHVNAVGNGMIVGVDGDGLWLVRFDGSANLVPVDVEKAIAEGKANYL